MRRGVRELPPAPNGEARRLSSTHHGGAAMKRCSMCGQTKPFDDFMWNRKSTGKRDSYCRPCRSVYKQAHYPATSSATSTTHELCVRLSLCRGRHGCPLSGTHPCVDCGETDPVVLEFDHLREKLFDIGRGIRDKNWDLLLAEIAKCEVVCANCHRRRTARRGGFAAFPSGLGGPARRADRAWPPRFPMLGILAGVTQLVELHPSKVAVASSSPVSRST